jgi:hypothetical protein
VRLLSGVIVHGHPLSHHYAARNEPNRLPLGCTLYSLSAGYNVFVLDGSLLRFGLRPEPVAKWMILDASLSLVHLLSSICYLIFDGFKAVKYSTLYCSGSQHDGRFL